MALYRKGRRLTDPEISQMDQDNIDRRYQREMRHRAASQAQLANQAAPEDLTERVNQETQEKEFKRQEAKRIRDLNRTKAQKAKSDAEQENMLDIFRTNQ